MSTPVRIVFCADTHLGFDFPVRPRLARRRRGPDFFANFQRVIDHAVSVKAHLLIHGGDLFTQSRPHRSIVEKAYQTLWHTAEMGIPIVLVPGNHEGSRLPSSLMLSHPNIYIFDRPRTYTFTIMGNTLAIAGFPFVRDIRDTFCELLTQTAWTQPPAHIRILCLHQTVEGAQVGPVDYTFRHGRTILPQSLVPQAFACVLAGHIHRRQTIIKPRCVPIHYPGSTERTSFAERHEEKGFLEVRLAKQSPSVVFHPLPARPMEDIYLDNVSADALDDYLKDHITHLDPDVVVRLRSRDRLEEAVRNVLTRRYLDDLFPPTMTVQLSSALFKA